MNFVVDIVGQSSELVHVQMRRVGHRRRRRIVRGLGVPHVHDAAAHGVGKPPAADRKRLPRLVGRIRLVGGVALDLAVHVLLAQQERLAQLTAHAADLLVLLLASLLRPRAPHLLVLVVGGRGERVLDAVVRTGHAVRSSVGCHGVGGDDAQWQAGVEIVTVAATQRPSLRLHARASAEPSRRAREGSRAAPRGPEAAAPGVARHAT